VRRRSSAASTLQNIPAKDFFSWPGKGWRDHPAQRTRVRIDSMLFAGYTIPPYYDSLLAKLVVHAEDREAAIARMKRALGELRIEGPKTTRDLHLALMDDPQFRAARFDTNWLEGWLGQRAT
jgi:acetyl-CoA carboxylase biotin carboxylase subunit